MASVFPNNPLGALPPETVKVFRLLKRLPDETYDVWQRLAIWSEPGPDFWVCHRSGRALLIKVSTATPQDARNARQESLFADERPPFGETEQQALRRQSRVRQLMGFDRCGKCRHAHPILVVRTVEPRVALLGRLVQARIAARHRYVLQHQSARTPAALR